VVAAGTAAAIVAVAGTTLAAGTLAAATVVMATVAAATARASIDAKHLGHLDQAIDQPVPRAIMEQSHDVAVTHRDRTSSEEGLPWNAGFHFLLAISLPAQ
jgi:hypothetical protein